jgi:hypothetical protein
MTWASGRRQAGSARTPAPSNLPLLVAREFHAFTFVFNGELEKPLHDPSRELASGFGFAFGRSFTRKVAMIELRHRIEHRLPARSVVLVNAGIIDGVRNASRTTTSAIRCSPTTEGISTPAAASRS